MADDDEVALNPGDAAQRRTLIRVLSINFTQFVGAGLVGIFANSTGLLGAALDNLADSAVYAVGLYAVGRSLSRKQSASRLSGILLIALAVGLLADVLRRFYAGAEPYGLGMIITALINAGTNFLCLRLLRAHRRDGPHLKASWIFTTNDMLANLGIVASGVAVIIFASPIPDLLIGLAITAIVLQGGIKILRAAKKA